MKYIQNTYSADIQVVLRTEDGRFSKNVVFPRYLVDRPTGQIISDGHLEVEDELYKELEKNLAFQLLVKKEKLVVKDKAPLKAGSFEQLMELKAQVEALTKENADLREKLAKYESNSAPAADDGLDKLKLDELKAKAKELGLDAENLKKKDDVIKLIREAGDKAGE